jgi:hypothetical protein
MTDPTNSTRYPLRVRGELTEPLNRWLWLVKWLLLIPHLIVLGFLWTAYVVVTVIAFFAILFTGQYPQGLFSFNRGVLRWSWRVTYYGYGALGTDRYPPFSLGAVPDYPATLDLDYPEQLSRGLVLVKWWLLALPHYLVLAALAGAATLTGDDSADAIGVLAAAVLIMGVALLFTGRYPRGLFDLVMGVNRWSLRVVVYATLMTDVYPPFRLDQGGEDVAVTEPSDPNSPVPAVGGVPASTGGASAGTVTGGSPAVRIVALVAGVLIIVPGLALIAAGGAGLWLNGQRDAAGFISTPTQSIASSAAAVTFEDVGVEGNVARFLSSNDLGQIRVRVTSTDTAPIFVGIAPQDAVDRWLTGRAYDEITDIDAGRPNYDHRTGAPTVTPPGEQPFWNESAVGPGSQELRWQVTSGTWSIVAARPDGTPGVNVRAVIAAKIPSLAGVSTGLLIGGLALILIGAALIVWGAAGLGHRTHRADPPTAPPTGPDVRPTPTPNPNAVS